MRNVRCDIDHRAAHATLLMNDRYAEYQCDTASRYKYSYYDLLIYDAHLYIMR